MFLCGEELTFQPYTSPFSFRHSPYTLIGTRTQAKEKALDKRYVTRLMPTFLLFVLCLVSSCSASALRVLHAMYHEKGLTKRYIPYGTATPVPT